MESPIEESSRKSTSKCHFTADIKKKASKHSSNRKSDSSDSPPRTKRRHQLSDHSDTGSDHESQNKHKPSHGFKSKSSNKEDRNNSSAKKKSKQDEEKFHKLKANDITSSNGGAGDMSLSIEETNKLRAKLGLKPLSVDADKPTEQKNSNEQDSSKKKTYIDKDTNQEFEHIPALNIAEIKEQKDFKQKLNEQREKRKLMDKIKNIKGIADESSDEDEKKISSAELWIKKQKEREEAIKKEKLLEEMDKQFESFSNNESKNKSYTSNQLKGLRVEHDQSYFREGQEVILTLKDKSILKGRGDNLDLDEDDDADVLVNVNIMDDEKAAKNNENKKKKTDYNPYDDFDEYGNFREKSILDKYDEELEGERKKYFRLGARGTYDASDDKFIEKLNEEHKARAIKLDILTELKPVTDYFTHQEIEAFKKPRKVRKVMRKSKMLKADDLMPLPDESNKNAKLIKNEHTVNEDELIFKKSFSKIEPESKSEKIVSLKDIEIDLKNERKRQNSRRLIMNEDSSEENSLSESDEDSIDLNKIRDNHDLKKILDEENDVLEELHSVLNKTRKRIIQPMDLKIKDESDMNDIESHVVSFENLNTFKEEPEEENFLTLDTMKEFCRNLGNAPTTSLANEEEDDEIMRKYVEKNDEKSLDIEREREDDQVENNQYMEISLVSKIKKTDDDENAGILEDEPIIDRGLASALRLAVNKGYLAKEKDKQNAKVLKANIEAVNFTIEEKNYYDIDDKYNRNRDRFSGPLVDFEEKSNYKPDVKIDYIDEKGHQMNEKEAFRYLSHRFHGKGSGKKKTEKRNKKYQEMETMQKMSSVDTPLNTVALLVEKQKKLQQPFVVLSAQKGGKQDQ